MKVVLVGGGVIGLMTALELADAGVEVVVLERGALAREASWAGGGIVSPLYPWRYLPAVTALSQYAQRVYPALASRLLEATGVDPELSACGMLMLEPEDVRDALVWAEKEKTGMEHRDRAALEQLLPWLPEGFRFGLWMPATANVRNPRLLRALRAYLEARAGVTIRESSEVQGFRMQGGRCTGVVDADGNVVPADHVVVCSGAWSSALLQKAGVDIPVRPVQGQMLLYRMDADSLPCMIMNQGRYLIPRRDGHVLCGSTLEEVGFHKQTTPEGRESLQASAARMWPALQGVEPVAQWAGLRPASPNGIPFIGEVPGIAGLWVNAGQFRNGLVLAPASARLLADQLLGREPVLEPAPYAVQA